MAPVAVAGSHCRRPLGGRGFTLLELLLSLFISSLLVGLLGLVFKNVQHAATSIESANASIYFESFLRKQLFFREERFDQLNLLVLEPRRIAFVTGFSAARGHLAGPHYVSYEFDPNADQLVYREIPLTAWWKERGDIDGWRTGIQQRLKRDGRRFVAFDEVGGIQFDYGYGDRFSDFVDGDELPGLLRLRWQTLEGVRELIAGLRYSSYPWHPDI